MQLLKVIKNMKMLPIGISDYKKLIEGNYYYVDKTLLVKEILETVGEVKLIPRPRRFGKTLNISMLRYFFEHSSENNSHLFTKTAIWQDSCSRNLQGQYPVIFLTFKDVKERTWESTYKKIREVIANEFKRHFAKLETTLSEFDLKKYTDLSTEAAAEETYSTSLFFLSQLLLNSYGKRVMVLIDEYDAPIHDGYAHDYYHQIVKFLRSLLTSVFKDNPHIERGVLTGILRTSKEGIFSGLNNLQVYQLTDTEFSDKFGFVNQEVKQLLNDYNVLGKSNEIQQWYNGYTFGQTTVYNPWSILSCVSKEGALKPYWVNTSDNKLVRKLITLSSIAVKEDLNSLLSGNTIEKEIDEAIIFPGIENDARAVWSLLLFTGYLTYTHLKLKEGKTICTLVIPNKEIAILYKGLIEDIFEHSLSLSTVQDLRIALTTGDTFSFAKVLQEFINSSMSVHDIPSPEPEKSYHLFVLGLLVLLADDYEIKSNRESGLGRYDIMIIPRKPNKLAIVIEFKKATSTENLEIGAKKALEQIKEKNYVQELKERGIKSIKLFGIAFFGKQLFVDAENVR